MEKVRLKIILDLMYQNERDMSISLHNVTMFSSAAVYHEMYRYSDFDVLFFTDYYGVPDFIDKWTAWKEINGENLYRKYEALYAEYNPIENYSMMEESLDGKKLDDTTRTETPKGKILNETSESGSHKTVTDMDTYGLGTNTAKHADKTTSTYTPTNFKTTTETSYGQGTQTETKDTHTNSMSDTFDGNTVSGYYEMDHHMMKRSGNIGTVTNMDMISQELQHRNNGLLSDFIHDFIMHNCIYIGGDH